MFRLATCDFFSRGLGLRHCGRGSAAPCGRRLRPCGRPRQKTHLAAVFFFTLVQGRMQGRLITYQRWSYLDENSTSVPFLT